MSTTQTNDTGRADGTEKDEFYIPAMPSQSTEPGRLERFVKGLDKGPRPE